MSRSGYSEDLDNWELIKWCGMVASAIRGKSGQKLLQEFAEAMDALLVKELIANRLQADGSYCALGVVGAKRGISIASIDPEDAEAVSAAFDISACLAKEISFINDEECWDQRETPSERWTRVRKWVAGVAKPLCVAADLSREAAR